MDNNSNTTAKQPHSRSEGGQGCLEFFVQEMMVGSQSCALLESYSHASPVFTTLAASEATTSQMSTELLQLKEIFNVFRLVGGVVCLDRNVKVSNLLQLPHRLRCCSVCVCVCVCV